MTLQEVMELDSGIMEALRHRGGRMPLTELATSLGMSASEAKAHAMAVLHDLSVSDDEVVLRLSPQERKDLETLEKTFSHGQRESIAALREIRERRLYREDYATFDDYMAGWHRTRQWATQQIQWLRRVELLEAATGKTFYQSQMSAHEVHALAPLDDLPELYVAAIQEADAEAERTGKKRSAKMIQAAVKHFTDFVAARAALALPDLGYDESRRWPGSGSRGCRTPTSSRRRKRRQRRRGGPLSDCLLEVCRSRHAMPADKHLLAVARGSALAAIVEPLATLRAEWDKTEKLREKQRKLEEERDESDEQIAPPEPAQPQGNRVAWPTSRPSAAAATDGEEEEESEEETGPAYRVLLTGQFEELAKGCLHQGGAEMELDASSLPELLSLFAEQIGEGWKIEEESSITVIPLTDEDADEEQEDEGEEETEEELDEDEAGDDE